MSDYNLPERRKAGYASLERKLDKHAERIEKRFHKRFRGMLIAFSIIGLTSAVALVGFGLLLQDQHDTADDLAVLVENNEQGSIEIQSQREDSIRGNCEDQNERNTNTKERLNAAAVAEIEKDPSVKAEVRANQKYTEALIDALQPVQDCDAVVAEAVQDPPPTKDKG